MDEEMSEGYLAYYNYDWPSVAKFSEEEFIEWWNGEKSDFNWNGFEHLVDYAGKYLHIWWDRDKWDGRCSGTMCKVFPNQFDIWFDEHKFDWNYLTIRFLELYCDCDKNKWMKSAIVWKLANEN